MIKNVKSNTSPTPDAKLRNAEKAVKHKKHERQFIGFDSLLFQE